MTVSSQQPSVLNGRPKYEPCEECGAPLDPQQRYCVNCAARRGNGANPASRYFATMSKRAHRPPLRAPAKTGSGSRAAAVGFFALLPIAYAHLRAFGALPLHHRDPFDRLLIAQALAEGIPIATADRIFSAYGVQVVW